MTRRDALLRLAPRRIAARRFAQKKHPQDFRRTSQHKKRGALRRIASQRTASQRAALPRSNSPHTRKDTMPAAKKSTTESTASTITVAAPALARMIVTIKGVTPLLTSNGAAAVPKLAAHMSGPKQKGPKAPRDSEADFQESRYLMADGADGFPGTGIKRALCDAAIRNHAGKGTEVKATVQIDADLVPIKSAPPTKAEHYVRHRGTPDLAYRAQYTSWSMDVPVTYNAGVIAQEHVVSLFELAGFSIGIGAWRPEKNGTFGRFIVADIKAM